MYQESNNSHTIGWLKIVVKILLAFLVVILSAKLISMIINNRDESQTKNQMQSNLETMMTVAKEYFVEEKLPKEVGSSLKVNLSDLIKDKKIESIKDADGKECSVDESFIKATKLDKEYQLKAYLVCGKDTDYLNEFIKIDNNITIKPSTTSTTTSTTTKKTTTAKSTTTTKKTPTTTTKKKTTTKKVTTSTTTKSYKVSFNSNGGSSINTIRVKENGKVKLPEEPVREGYKFIGWYYRGVEFDFNTKIKQDYILIAKWTK